MPATLTASYRLNDRDLLFTEPTQQNHYVLRFRDLADEERPRERLLKLGPAHLSVAELLTVIWGVGSRKEDVMQMAQRTLKDYGKKAVGNEHDPRKLSQAADIPLTKACQLVASFELGRRYYARRHGRPVHVRNAAQAYQYLKDMSHNQKEHLRGLYLDSRYQVVHDEVISIGSLTANVVHPREVFQPALERGAVAVILAHNHPSNHLEPTMADMRITEQLIAAGKILGIDLLDHLIITSGQFRSVLECIENV